MKDAKPSEAYGINGDVVTRLDLTKEFDNLLPGIRLIYPFGI